MSDQTHLVAGPLQIQRPIDTRGKQQQEQQLGQFPPPTSSSNLLALSRSLSLSLLIPFRLYGCLFLLPPFSGLACWDLSSPFPPLLCFHQTSFYFY